jgi:hypothetical protein
MLVDEKNPVTAEKVAQILAKSKELVKLAAKRVPE